MPSSKKTFSNLLDDYHLLSFDELDSTNEEAKRLAMGGGSHGAVIWAKKQTAGKGRMGRKWISQEGNLYVSILLQPTKPQKNWAELSFVAALAVMESIGPMLPKGKALQCKWPNDILLDDQKLSGILLESFRGGDAGEGWAVVGVGVNVESFPKRTEFPATCLNDAGVELVSAKIILSRFIHHFIEEYNSWNEKGFADVRTRWMSKAWRMGETILAHTPDDIYEGVAQEIDAHGSLVITMPNGKKQHILAADIFPPEALKKKG